jgi:predicted nuclease of predicted toxin-antitoxin system
VRFKIDENLPREVVTMFEGAGHEAATAGDQHLSGADDENLVMTCRRESRVLVTCDLDFCDAREYPPHLHAGIVVLRLGSQLKPHVLMFCRSSAGSCRSFLIIRSSVGSGSSTNRESAFETSLEPDRVLKPKGRTEERRTETWTHCDEGR